MSNRSFIIMLKLYRQGKERKKVDEGKTGTADKLEKGN